MTDKELIAVAQEAREAAYAPYSGFKVGAALLAASGRVYTGCNVENASYPLTTCAERTAVVKAISEGEERFVAVAVVTATGAMPCGACRQILSEFSGAGGELRVVVSDTADHMQIFSLRDLLPMGFDPQQLKLAP